ncbi:HD domain-containing phosphohydrolase [Maridesulfovibrio zosterae]|uniref:HD domain-containing phosphohydrolase n=1 Tax=Maridesulfovibrio zosterae TaxID=82171 RepID=UPI00041F8459|nr:HD domain-containing phosphohydrolase [Maridesulfovibrio zosterae]
MKPRILLVDDEPNVLSSLKRQLRKYYDIHTETGPASALSCIDPKKPFSVVISDYKMPGMNGIEFLTAVKSRSPETVRMILTGYADLTNAISAVNDGHVFRFLTKPCDKDALLNNIKDAVYQYDLVTGKRVLLEQTLKKSVELLTEITSLVTPEAGERINRVRRYVRYLATKKGAKDLWKYDIATMLSQLGTLILPSGILDSLLEGDVLTPEQIEIFEMHPVVAKSLVSKLPRLGSIAEIISYQLKGFDGSGTPRDGISGEDIPLGGRILRLALDYDMWLNIVGNPRSAFAKLEEQVEVYDPELLYYIEGMLGVEARYEIKDLNIKELYPGMILYKDVTSNEGALLLRKSLELDKDKIDRIVLFVEKVGVAEPICVLVPG